MKHLIYAAAFLFFAACAGNSLNAPVAPPPQTLPVVQLQSGSATTWQEYPASVEGTVNIEIPPAGEWLPRKNICTGRRLCIKRATLV
jgi:membrane fusion protein (multidrug efflux system)